MERKTVLGILLARKAMRRALTSRLKASTKAGLPTLGGAKSAASTRTAGKSTARP